MTPEGRMSNAPHAAQDEGQKEQALREAYEAGWRDSHDHFEPFERSWFPPTSVDDGFAKFIARTHSRKTQ